MPKYLIMVSYSAEGQQGLLREGGTARKVATEAVIQRVGGTLVSHHFALGGHDVYVIADLPNNAAAAAVAATIGATGAVRTFETIPLLEPSEIDAAIKLSPIYRAPGR